MLAQKAYPDREFGLAEDDPITSYIMDRFCGGQSDAELGRHLSLYPSYKLNNLVCACVKWESSKSQTPYKPKETMFAMQTEEDYNPGPTMDDLEEFARENGYVLQPKV